MKKTIRKIIAGMLVCSTLSVCAMGIRPDFDGNNITTGVVLATGTDASTEESTGSGGVLPSEEAPSRTEAPTTETPAGPGNPERPGNPARPGNPTRPGNTTETPTERDPGIVDVEEEAELAEVRQTYTEQTLPESDGFFIYQVQAAKPYYRVFFAFDPDAGVPSADLISEEYMEGVHGEGNMLQLSETDVAGRLEDDAVSIHKNYTFMLNVSSDIDETSFLNAKEQIISFVENLQSGDAFTIYTNSEDLAGYKLIDRSYKEDAGVDASALELLQTIGQEPSTVDWSIVRERVLYDRLEYNQTFENDTPPDDVMVLIEITVADAEETESAANGFNSDIYAIDIDGDIAESLTALEAALGNIYVVDLRGRNNQADQVEQDLILYLYDDENQIRYAYEPYAIQINKGLADRISPEIEWIRYADEDNTIWIKYSEPVVHADNADHYQVVKKDTREPVAITSIDSGNNTGDVYVLTLAEIETAGEYEVVIEGSIDGETITDESAEQNPFAHYTYTLSIEQPEEPEPEDQAKKKLSWWEILLIAMIVVMIAAAVLIVVRRRSKAAKDVSVRKKEEAGTTSDTEEEENEPYEKSPGAITLLLQRNGETIREVRMEVGEGLVVGGADVSDVVIDEPGAASEHFVIEYDGESFYVQDLVTLMGTSLNGIKMKHKRRLENEDRIGVGGLDIVVRF